MQRNRLSLLNFGSKENTETKELQAFFTEHFYTCTPQILKSLAESYAGGGSMTENIDEVGGEGTGAFAKQVIDIYTQKML